MELLFSLIAGLIIAFALQLLLANLGIALGLTVLNFSPGQASAGKSISLPITHLLGFGVALSLSTVLFAAGLLTAEFSQISAPRRGLIFGIILWATYWLLFIWLSSTTLSNIADSLLGTALAGGRRLIKTIGQQLGEPESEEQTVLKDLAKEVSELAEKQKQIPQHLATQQEALLAEIKDLVSNREVAPPPVTPPVVEELNATAGLTPSSLMSRLNLPSGRQLLQRAIDQVDTSNIDIQTLWHQIYSDDSENVIELDVVDYLRETPVWMFQPQILKETFYERIYDPKAAPEKIRAQLAKLDHEHFVGWLQERGDLATDQIEAVANQLNQIKDSVIKMVSSSRSDSTGDAIDETAIETIQGKLIAYCRYTNLDVLSADSLVEKLTAQLAEHFLTSSASVAKQLDLDAIQSVLERRRGLEPAQQQTLMVALRSALPNSSEVTLSAPRRWVVRQPTRDLTKRLTKQITHYLQHQDKSSFQPAHMVRDLTHLAKASLGSLSDGLPDPLFDKATWQQELEKRRDMTADEIQQTLVGAESAWQQAFQQVNSWAKTSWSEVQETIASKTPVGTAQRQITEGLSAAQQTLETKANAVKADLQTQADAARGQVAIAAWWLFGSLLLSGVSAAASGWLAVIY
ncbi:MAG: hypothetical protein AAGI69_09970 [Cyanobacteria bacterium P01_H01_bin.21]